MIVSPTIKSIQQRKDKLFFLVCQFNSNPASYIHQQYLNQLHPSLISVLQSSTRGISRLNQYILKHWNIDQAFFTDFSNIQYRMALLDKEVINQLLLYAGVIFYATNISQIVQKNTILELKALIGDQPYEFAIKKASLFNTIKPKITSLNPNPANLGANIFVAGQRMFEYLLANESHALLERFKLKFDPSYTWNFNRNINSEDKQAIFTFLHRLLTKEINPDWQICFT